MSNKILSVLFLSLSSFVASNELVCNFIQHIDGYNCEVSSSFSEDITSIDGRHISNNTNADVEVIFAPSKSNITDFPAGACLHFENLRKFDINGRNVNDLSRSIFRGCKRVQQVKIIYTKMREFEENLLYDLPMLNILIITESSLEHLQRNFLKSNTQLKTLDLSYNRLTSISTIIPPSVTIIKLYNNPCIDSSLYPNDFHKIHEQCPDENKMLSFNLTDTMKKFQHLHLMILDLSRVAESALDELDERIEKQLEQRSENRTKVIEKETLDRTKAVDELRKDLNDLALGISKQNEELDNIKQKQKENYEKIQEQMAVMQQRLNSFSNDHNKLDNVIGESALERNFSADRKFIYLGFAMNALMFAIFILFAFIRITRPTKRDAMLLNNFDN